LYCEPELEEKIEVASLGSDQDVTRITCDQIDVPADGPQSSDPAADPASNPAANPAIDSQLSAACGDIEAGPVGISIPIPIAISEPVVCTAALASVTVYPGGNALYAEPETFLERLGRYAALSSLMGGVFLNYFLLQCVNGYFNWCATGVQCDQYMNNSTNVSFVGVLTAMFCSGEFLGRFCGIKSAPFLTAIKVILALSVCGLALLAGGFSAAAVAVLAVTVILAVRSLARATRQALPSGFRLRRAGLGSALAVLPVALFLAWAVVHAVCNPVPADVVTHYSDFSHSEIFVLIFFLVLGLGLPSFVVARCARTSAFKPVFALCLLQQSPLIAGFLLLVGLLFAQNYSVIGLLTGLGTLAVLSGVIGSAAFLGVKTNGILHRNSLKSSL
jgi:hypothetical protein